MHGYKWPINSPRTRRYASALESSEQGGLAMMKELETLKEGMAATTVVAAACAEGPGVVGPIFVDKCRNYLQVRGRVCCRVVLQTQTMHGSAHRGTLVLDANCK